MRSASRQRILGAFVACAMAASAAAGPSAWPQSASDVNSFVGKLYIIRGRGSVNEIKIRASEVTKPQGQCDKAVAVDSVSQSANELRLVLVPMGGVRYPKGSSVCPMVPSQIRVTISEIQDSGPASAAAVMHDFLLMPESYMESLGDKFEYQGGDSPDLPVAAQSTPNLTQPKIVLMVDPAYTDAARRAKVSGTAVAEVTIGRDGHLYSASLLRDPGYGLGEQTLRVLGLWRFAPATVDGKPVALRVSLETSFTLH